MAYYQNQGALPIFDRRAGNYNMAVDSPYSPQNNGGPGNPGTANNMPKPMLPRFQQFQNNKGPAPLTPQDRSMYGGINPGNMYSMIEQLRGMSNLPPGAGQFIRPGDLGNQGQYTMSQRQPYETQRSTGGQGDPFNQYGYAGQSGQLGRYVPPMMGNVNDMNSWQGGGGYAYNIPNSYGSGQWNQFNSNDVAFPQFGQPGSNGSMRYRPFNESPPTGFAYSPIGTQGNPPPSYQSPFGRPDPARQQNYISYMMSLAQGQQPTGNNPTQPGAPDQAGPVT